MIDLSFAKIAIIGFVALLILGPEKLPHAARVAGSLLGRMQRYINNVKSEVAQDMALDELRKSYMEVGDMGRRVAKGLSGTANAVQQEIKATYEDTLRGNKPAAPAPPPRGDATQRRNTKAQSFRRLRLTHAASVPNWYKKQCRSGKRVNAAVSSLSWRKLYRPSGGIPLSF